MRRIVRVGLLVGVLVAGFYMLRSNSQEDTSGETAPLDRAVPEAERGWIDPHGPGTPAKVSSPLRVTARVRSATQTSALLDIEVVSSEKMRDVRIDAHRYDSVGSTDASWSGTLWSGALDPDDPVTLEAEVPFGTRRATSVVVRAATETPAGARIAASDVVFLEGAPPAKDPVPVSGVVEYEGHADSVP